jgi:hypothetical protein
MPGATVANIQGWPQFRRSVSTRSVLAGQVLWLPRKEELGIDATLEHRCYNHPVVTLSPELLNGNVIVLIVGDYLFESQEPGALTRLVNILQWSRSVCEVCT